MSLTPEQAALAAQSLARGPGDSGYLEEPQALARLTTAATGHGVTIKTIVAGDVIDM